MIGLIPTLLTEHAAFAPYRESLYELLQRIAVMQSNPSLRSGRTVDEGAGWARHAHPTSAKHPPQQCSITVGRGCPPYNDYRSGRLANEASARPERSEGSDPKALPTLIPPPARALSAIDFERRVVEQNELIVRPNSLHDLMNALVWMTFPKTKRAISEAHVALGVNKDGKTRPRRRDVLTLFDESGIIILSENDELRAMNQQHRWRELFVTHRSDFIRQARPILFGHGAMEQLGGQLPQVHRGLTVKALWLPLPMTTPVTHLDDYLAQRIHRNESLNEAARAIPLPVLGLPGWFAENELPHCYDDETVFRPIRLKI